MTMLILNRILPVLTITLLFGCDIPPANVPSRSQDFKKITASDSRKEEYKVYAVVVSELFQDNSPLVIYRSTSTDYFYKPEMLKRVLDNVRKQIPLLSKDILDDFLRNNKDHHVLEDNFLNERTTFFLTIDEGREMFSKSDGWEKFRKMYPSSVGVVTLSNVGFDLIRQRAFVYISCQKATLDGFGYYILLERTNDKWRIADKFAAWFS
ncbi:MAG: hypothetical protein C4308_15215 [Chitinophagaceae bacterium]